MAWGTTSGTALSSAATEYDSQKCRQKQPLEGTITSPPTVKAVQHVARLQGGSQPHVMRCSDGHYYVVKFPNNPQGITILANELLGHQIARFLGLPIPPCAIVEVDARLIELTKELRFETPREFIPCQPGQAFGSGCRMNAWSPARHDRVPGVQNTRDFWGMLVFDKFTSNTDGRQVLYVGKHDRFRVEMIDNGFCFNAGEWDFADSPIQGLYTDRAVYRGVTGLDSFESWLVRLEEDLDLDILQSFANYIPAAWYGWDCRRLELLLGRLDRRRHLVVELLSGTLKRLAQEFQEEEWRKLAKPSVLIKFVSA